jgi:diacylglycerol kinase family enzyme
VVSEFFNYRSLKYKIRIGEEKQKVRAFFISFANASQYGNNVYIAPEANLQDGMIDVCIMHPFPKIQAFPLGFKLFRKKIGSFQYLDIIQAKEIVVKRKKEGVIHLDGEPVMTGKKLSVKIIPSSLNVISG